MEDKCTECGSELTELDKVVWGIELWIEIYKVGSINEIQLAEALEVGVGHLRRLTKES